MRVLVIGGSGNISTEIVKSLLSRGHEVTCVTRGRRPLPDGVRAVVADRKDRPAFEAAMAAESPEVVIDMIAFHPDDTASALRAFGGRVAQFIQCSTVMTYGPPLACHYGDETMALNARGAYGQNKILIDELLLSRHATEGLPVTIVKPSYTYGPGIPLHRQIHDDERWIDRLRKGKPMLSPGDGDKLFQFLPSRDAGEFFALLVGREQAIGQVYNMVHPDPITWDDWHRMAIEALGSRSEIVHCPTDTLMAIDATRFGRLFDNFGYEQVFDGSKAHRDVPEWQPDTDRVAWVAKNIAWMEAQGTIVDTDADEDDLEDRIIAAMQAVPTMV